MVSVGAGATARRSTSSLGVKLRAVPSSWESVFSAFDAKATDNAFFELMREGLHG